MDGIKIFSIKGCHLSLKSLAGLFLIAMYRSITIFLRNWKLNIEKGKRSSAKLQLYYQRFLRLEALSLAPVDICKVE